MDERELRRLIGDVKKGRLSRRGFVRRMMAVGLAAPLANQLLAFSGVAMAQSRPSYKPTKRGGGGPLKVLWWQGPTLLNPHFDGENPIRLTPAHQRGSRSPASIRPSTVANAGW